MWMGYKLLMISTRSHLAIFWVKIDRWKIRSQKCHIFRQYALFKSEIGYPCQKIHAKESCDFWEKKKRLRKICMEKTGWRVGLKYLIEQSLYLFHIENVRYKQAWMKGNVETGMVERSYEMRRGREGSWVILPEKE
jgi:hypothetical protein